MKKGKKIIYALAISAIMFLGETVIFSQGKYDVKWNAKEFDVTKCTVAVNLGYVPAMINLARYNYNKTHDYETALALFERAADKGSAVAQEGVGNCYYNGYGVKQNYKQAALCYKEAAVKGISSAQTKLGNCYCNGLGVLQDYKQAIKWFSKAAEKGNPDAQYSLAECYYYGTGVDQNISKAAELYEKAAEKGNPNYQYTLALLYYYGEDIEQNFGKAVKLLTSAAKKGNKDAKELLSKLVLTKPTDFKWEYNSSRSGIIITGFATVTDKSTIVRATLPSTVDGKPVTEIKQETFALCTALESIKLPETLTKIGLKAFFSCKSLKSIKLPPTVTLIEEKAFYGCESLSETSKEAIRKCGYKDKF